MSERSCGEQYGTHAGAVRHQRAGTALCGACKLAEREHQRALYHDRRTKASQERMKRQQGEVAP